MESPGENLPKKPRLSYDSSIQRRAKQASTKIRARARLFREASMFKGFAVEECQRSNGSALRSKYNIHHKEMRELKLEHDLFTIRGHRCAKCLQIFSFESHLNRHMKFCRNTLVFIPGKIGPTAENESLLRDPSSEMLLCPWCPLLCSSMPALQKHLPNCREAGRQRVQEETFKKLPCPECPSHLVTVKNLLLHLQSHYVGDILCSPCNKSFLSFKSLSKHLQTCTSKEFYKCSDCGKRFINALRLLKHLPHCRVPTQCLKCAEVVIERRSCMDHMTMHLNTEWSKLGLKMTDGVLRKVPEETMLAHASKNVKSSDLSELSPKTGRESSPMAMKNQTPVKLPSPHLTAKSSSSKEVKSVVKMVSESSASQTFSSLKMPRLDLDSSFTNSDCNVRRDYSSSTDSDEEDHGNRSQPINFDNWSCDEMSESADDNFSVVQHGLYEIENDRGDAEYFDEPEISCDLSFTSVAAEEMTDPLMPDLEVQMNSQGTPLDAAQICNTEEEVRDPTITNPEVEKDAPNKVPSLPHLSCNLDVIEEVREPAMEVQKNDTSHLFTPAANNSELTLTVVNVEGGANLFNWDDECDANNEDIPESVGYSENITPLAASCLSLQTGSNYDSYVNTDSKSDGNEDGDSGIDATEDQDSNRDRTEEVDVGNEEGVPDTALPTEVSQAGEVLPSADTSNEETSSNLTVPGEGFVGNEVFVSSGSIASTEVFISSSSCDNEVVVECPVEQTPKKKKSYSVLAEHSYAVPEGQLVPWFKYHESKPKRLKAISVKRVKQPVCKMTNKKKKKKKSGKPIHLAKNVKTGVKIVKASTTSNEEKNENKSEQPVSSKKKIVKASAISIEEKNENKPEQPVSSKKKIVKASTTSNEEKNENKSEHAVSSKKKIVKASTTSIEERNENKPEQPVSSKKKIVKASTTSNEEKNENKPEQPVSSKNKNTYGRVTCNVEASQPVSQQPKTSETSNEITSTSICRISIKEANVASNSTASNTTNCSIDYPASQVLDGSPVVPKTSEIIKQAESKKFSILTKLVKLSGNGLSGKAMNIGTVRKNVKDQTLMPLIQNGRTIGYLRVVPTLTPIKTAPSAELANVKESQTGTASTGRPEILQTPKSTVTSDACESSLALLPLVSANMSKTTVTLTNVKAVDQLKEVSSNSGALPICTTENSFNNSTSELHPQLAEENDVTEKQINIRQSKEKQVSSSPDLFRSSLFKNATEKVMQKMLKRERSMLSRGFVQMATSLPYRKDRYDTNLQSTTASDVGDIDCSSIGTPSGGTTTTQPSSDTCLLQEGFSEEASRKCATVLKETARSEVQKSVIFEPPNSDNSLMFIMSSDGTLVPHPNFKSMPVDTIGGSKENMPPTGLITHPSITDSKTIEVIRDKPTELVQEVFQKKESVALELQKCGRHEVIQHSQTHNTGAVGAEDINCATHKLLANDTEDKSLPKHLPLDTKEIPVGTANISEHLNKNRLNSELTPEQTICLKSASSVLENKRDATSADKEIYNNLSRLSPFEVCDIIPVGTANLSEHPNENSLNSELTAEQTTRIKSASPVLNKQDGTSVDKEIYNNLSRLSPFQICDMELCSDSSNMAETNEEPKFTNIHENDGSKDLTQICDSNYLSSNLQSDMELSSDDGRSHCPDSDRMMSGGSSDVDISEPNTPQNECSDLYRNAVNELLLVNMLKSLKLTNYKTKNKIVKQKRRRKPLSFSRTNFFSGRKLMSEMKRLRRKKFGREGLLKNTSIFNCSHCTQWFYFKTDLEHHICLKLLIQQKFTSEHFNRFFDGNGKTQKEDRFFDGNGKTQKEDRFFDGSGKTQKEENDMKPITLSLNASKHDAQPSPTANEGMSPLETFFSMRLQRRKRRFSCQMCQLNFKSFSALHDHKTDVHAEKPSLQCHICGKEFSRLQKLAVHFAKSHRTNSKVSESKEDNDTLGAEVLSNIKVEDTGTESCSKSKDNVPIQTGTESCSKSKDNVPIQTGTESCIKSKDNVPIQTGTSNPTIENEATEGSSYSKESVPTQTDSSDLATKNEDNCCKICKKTFSAKGGLKSHMNQAHGTVYKCPICLRRFTYLTTMKIHFMKHFASLTNSEGASGTFDPSLVTSGNAEEKIVVPNEHTANKDEEPGMSSLNIGNHSLSKEKQVASSDITNEGHANSSAILETTSKSEKFTSAAESSANSSLPGGVKDVLKGIMDKQDEQGGSNAPIHILDGVSQDRNSFGNQTLVEKGTTSPNQGKKRKKSKWVIVKDASSEEISSPEIQQTDPKMMNGHDSSVDAESQKLVISLSKVKKPRHKCQDCDKSFKKQHHLALHRLEVHANGPFMCPICHEEQSDSLQLQAHLQKCDDKTHNQKLSKGNNESCLGSNSDNPTLSVSTHHNHASKVDEVNSCEQEKVVCDVKKSEDKEVSEVHTHSQSENDPEVDLPVQISTSSSEVQPSSSLPISEKRQSRKNSRYQAFSDSLRKEHVSSPVLKGSQPKRGLWRCNECLKNFGSKGFLERHNIKNHGAPCNFNCPHCGKIFTDVRSLRFHIKTKHAKKKKLMISSTTSDNSIQSEFTETADVSTLLGSEGGADTASCEIPNDVHTTADSQQIVAVATSSDVMDKSETLPASSSQPLLSTLLGSEGHADTATCEIPNDVHTTADSQQIVAVATFSDVIDNSETLPASSSQPVEAPGSVNLSPAEQPVNDPSAIVRNSSGPHGNRKKLRKCKYCQKTFKRGIDLKKHYRMKHHKRPAVKATSVAANEPLPLKKESGAQSSPCKDLSPKRKKSSRKCGISEFHKIEKDTDLNQSCYSEGSTQKGSDAEVQSDEGGAFKCTDCPLTYRTFSCLKRHRILIHAEPASYYCSICGKGFSYPHSLKNHVMTHSRGVQKTKRSERPERRVKCHSCEGQCNGEDHHSKAKDDKLKLPVDEHCSNAAETSASTEETEPVGKPVVHQPVSVETEDSHLPVQNYPETNSVTVQVASPSPAESSVPNNLMQISPKGICAAVKAAEPCPDESTIKAADPNSSVQGDTAQNSESKEMKTDAAYSAVSCEPSQHSVHWDYPLSNGYAVPPIDPVPASAPGFNASGPWPQPAVHAEYPFWNGASLNNSPSPFMPNSAAGFAGCDTPWTPPFEEMKAMNACSLCGLCLPSWYALQEHYYRAHPHPNAYNAPEPYPAPQTVPIPWLSPWQTTVQNQSVAQNISPNKVCDAPASSFEELTSRNVAHCSVCGLCFPTLFALREHYVTHMAPSSIPSFPYGGFY